MSATRVYLHPDRIRTLKVGETFSLDHSGEPPTHIVAFDGRAPQGWMRWVRESDGRVFLYTDEQAILKIYHLRYADGAVA
jgi:hypothetical protein